MNIISKVVSLSNILIMAACTFGNGHICGPQTPRYYCDHDAYEKVYNPKPMIAKWEKQGVSNEDRFKDWMDCGGRPSGLQISTPELDYKVMDSKDSLPIYYAALKRVSECMKSRGYEWKDDAAGT